jgi:hypothetical protein
MPVKLGFKVEDSSELHILELGSGFRYWESNQEFAYAQEVERCCKRLNITSYYTPVW